MGPNRQRRKKEAPKKKLAPPKSHSKLPTLVSSAAKDLIADVLHHAASGGSVPVPDKHFDSSLGGKITLQRNSPLTTVQILIRLYEGLGFPSDLVTHYVADLLQAGEFPSFSSIEDLLAPDSPFQNFLVESCFALFNCITMFKKNETKSTNSSFDAEAGDKILNDELESAMILFEAQYVGKINFEDDASGDREIYFLMVTGEEKRILIAVRFTEYYPLEPPMLFIQPLQGTEVSQSPTLGVLPNCTTDLSPTNRRLIIDAAIEVITSFSEATSGCLVPLLSSVNGVISDLRCDTPINSPPASLPPSRDDLKKKRQEFLSSLREGRCATPGVSEKVESTAVGSPSLMLPEKIKLATVEKEYVVSEKKRRSCFPRSKELDEKLKAEWIMLNEQGTLSCSRKKLPAFEMREKLKDALRTSNVVVVGGETGSGKTTQIPQYLYEFFCEDGRGSIANIICTQPRRLAATSVALRVAEERDDTVGGSVGYSIRLESCTSSRTQIMYCTTGIVLRRLQTDKYLDGVSHIIVDEIHERGVDTDFLLILLRDLLSRRNDLIVVLMSATMDSELFSRYFGGAPTLSIKGRTFPVQVYHLEEVIPLVNYHLDPGSPYERRVKANEISQRNLRKSNLNLSMDDVEYDLEEQRELKKIACTMNASPETVKTISRMDLDVINFELIESIVLHIDQSIRVEGAVLVFLPGMAEIQQCVQQLESNPLLRKRCIFFNLHSSLGSAEQQGVFAKPPRGKRKVIVGTNIMETSITIDDAVYVIDCGKVRENRYNPQKCMSVLVTATTSKANCKQRQGRAGRVREGYCFRLFTASQYEEMEDHQLCEMHRVSLDSLILQIYSLHLGDEVEYLQKALNPPEEKAIKSSVNVLMTLGALTWEKRLTSLGEHLANLPLDVRVGKMIIHGALLQCVDPVLTIAACISVRSPFLGDFELRAEVESMRRSFTGPYLSDQLSSYFAYTQWISTFFKSGTASARKFCQQAFLSPNSLFQIQSTKKQYERYLFEAGFLEGSVKANASHSFLFPPYTSLSDTVYESGGEHFNQNSKSALCILACLVAGLYPNVARMKAPQTAPPGGWNASRKPAARFITFDGTDCKIHPSSLAARGDTATAQLVVYVDKVKTSDVYLREVSVVRPLHVILFGGGKLEYLERYKELCVDEATAFQCEEEEATLLMHIKDQLHSALTTKINDPSKSWESVSKVVVRAIVKLITDDSHSARALRVIDRRQPRRPLTENLIPDETEDPTKSRKRVCFHCGEADHAMKDCPHIAQEKKGGPTSRCFICGMWHFPLFCSVAKS